MANMSVVRRIQKFQKGDRVRLIARPSDAVGKTGKVTAVETYFDYYGYSRKLYNVKVNTKTYKMFSFELSAAR